MRLARWRRPRSSTRIRGLFSRLALATSAGVSLAPLPAAAGTPPCAFPLRVSTSARTLVDDAGRPFRVQGDAAWSMVANLRLEEVEQYLSDRAARGFNALLVNLLEHKFAERAPQNLEGDSPFSIPGDFSRPNEAYFSYAEQVLEKAAARGFAVFLVPMYLGFHGEGEGWWSELNGQANSRAACRAYGRFVGAHFKHFSNLVWVMGGDFTPPSGSEGEARLVEIMEGIREAGATQLMTGHFSPESRATAEAAFTSRMDIDAVYSYDHPYRLGREAYAGTPARPAFLLETWYEVHPPNWGAAPHRQFEYWGALSTVGGAFYGADHLWFFGKASLRHWWGPWWRAAMSWEGAREMSLMGALLDSVPWFDLVPSGLDGMPELVASGGGEYGGDDYVVAAATRAGDALLAYVPSTGTSSRSFEIDMGAMRGPARARWFNPTNGEYLPAGPTLPTLANSGRRGFATPGDNGTGHNDWVLVLDTPTDAAGASPAASGGRGPFQTCRPAEPPDRAFTGQPRRGEREAAAAGPLAAMAYVLLRCIRRRATG